MKQRPCCARIAGRLTSARDTLAKLARTEAYHHQRGHSVVRIQQMLRDQKAEIERIKEAQVEHEAEHANEVVPA